MADSSPNLTEEPVTTETTVDTLRHADDAEAALVEDELLIEEISIDGMCGVY